MKFTIFLMLGIFVLLPLNASAGRSFQETVTVDGAYYTMSLYQDNAENMFHRQKVDMTGSHVHEFLSSHSQAAEAIEPGFKFPFYGHDTERFFVTTHGFLSFAPGLHNLMYKTQYIAPLRVKLDPGRYNDSTINYILTDDSLTIQWTNVTISEPVEHPSGGRFSFQASLYSNGTIVFVYIDIPALLTTDALYDNEPVAGLSDAFIVGNSELHVYHSLNVDNVDIRSQAIVIFHPKPTCIQAKTCGECSTMATETPFDCVWCDHINRCSDGADRLREHWDNHGCNTFNTSTLQACDNSGVPRNIQKHIEWRNSMVHNGEDNNESESSSEPEPSNASSPSSAVAISVSISVILVVIFLGLIAAFVFVYGRSNPGGLAERIANRLEANYKRFGGPGDLDDGGQVELGSTKGTHANNNNNNNNNNNINFQEKTPQHENNMTVCF